MFDAAVVVVCLLFVADISTVVCFCRCLLLLLLLQLFVCCSCCCCCFCLLLLLFVVAVVFAVNCCCCCLFVYCCVYEAGCPLIRVNFPLSEDPLMIWDYIIFVLAPLIILLNVIPFRSRLQETGPQQSLCLHLFQQRRPLWYDCRLLRPFVASSSAVESSHEAPLSRGPRRRPHGSAAVSALLWHQMAVSTLQGRTAVVPDSQSPSALIQM